MISTSYPRESEIPSEIDLNEYLMPSDEIFKISLGSDRNQILKSLDRSVKKGRWIFIDKSNFTLTFYDRDNALREWKIAVGNAAGNKQRKGDNRTPNGVFKIRQIQDSSNWTHDFRDGNGLIEGAYGPWFIRLHTPPWTGIGIHGTHDPDSISSRASEGCIRMNNEDVSELKKMVRVGMPVVIVEQS
jgi:lipoprotein-anchoring transpeptidase ErfK/SrfK